MGTNVVVEGERRGEALPHVYMTSSMHVWLSIRERDSVLYLGMAKEISNLPY